jgi:Serine phosphatase RsbU, regulator of sigma subunit
MNRLTEHSGAPVTPTTQGPFHLLLVEDSDTQAMRLRIVLEARGWHVTRAASGEEMRANLFPAASDPARPALFDLVLLDYHLPDTDGDVLCREIRGHPATRNLPVLMLTASAGEDTELRGLQSGADDYVSKAAPNDVLLARLEILLVHARDRADLRERYEREHRVAEELQMALLSTAPEDAFAGLSIRTLYEAAWDEAQIGGDFYDIRALEAPKVAIIIGDVAGKGLRAATFTAEVKFALRAILHDCADPGQALTKLNDFLVEGSNRNPWSSTAMVALCLALYDTATGEVRLAAAGTEPPLHLRRSEDGVCHAHEVSEDQGPFLGVMEGMTYTTVALTLAPGDALMLFTDGLTEARQRRGPMLGYEALAELARTTFESTRGAIDPVVDTVLTRAKEIAGGQLMDDACLIALQRKPEGAPPSPPS